MLLEDSIPVEKTPLILTIDDDMTIRSSFLLYLEDQGYEGIGAADGEEGVKMFMAHRPDLIIVDLRMPKMDGFEVLKAVRTECKETPVIVISGTGAASDVVKALTVGATGFLTKPIMDMSVLADKISEALEHKRLKEQNRRYQKGLETTIARMKTMQKQLVESEKMASLGSLVAGVAHEINTPVGIGVTASSHLKEKIIAFKREYAAGNASHEDLEQFLNTTDESIRMIEGNLARAANLIRSFKKVAVDQSSESPRSFNIREYIEDILLSLKPRMKRTGHQIKLDCPDDLQIQSYPGALAQIITNLIMNALIHAFVGRNDGVISITVSQRDENVVIDCSDDGIGMAQDVVDKVFEPFFTTRRGSGGSGLGMHMVFNLVTQTLGGDIQCHSELDRGTRYTITFPRQEGAGQ